jgi:hypothetical protein
LNENKSCAFETTAAGTNYLTRVLDYSSMRVAWIAGAHDATSKRILVYKSLKDKI